MNKKNNSNKLKLKIELKNLKMTYKLISTENKDTKEQDHNLQPPKRLLNHVHPEYNMLLALIIPNTDF